MHGGGGSARLWLRSTGQSGGLSGPGGAGGGLAASNCLPVRIHYIISIIYINEEYNIVAPLCNMI